MNSIDAAIALGQRFSGVSIEQRRLGETNWPLPVRVRLVTAKRARHAYAEPVYGKTVEDACRALVTRVSYLDGEKPPAYVEHRDFTNESCYARCATGRRLLAEPPAVSAVESDADRLRRLVREYTALVEACHEPPYDGNRDELAKAYVALLQETR